MIIVLATGNKGKIREFKKLMPNDRVITYSELIDEFDIVEDGSTFQENAIIKAKAVDKKISQVLDESYVVISDDSGITVPALNNEPDIYSARYAGVDATDKQNLEKLINRLKDNTLERSSAYYTACIAIVYESNIYTVHGWMYGDVISRSVGNSGFGYDPMFIPSGYDETLGQLDDEIKKSFSHRSNALKLAKRVLALFIT